MTLTRIVKIRVPVASISCVLIALISFIMKLYLLFRVNFLYSKVIFN